MEASKSCPSGCYGALAYPVLFCAALLVLLSGCASNSVTTLMKASTQTDATIPSAAVIQSELRGRAFKVGTVVFDLRKAGDKQGPDIPDSAYLKLLGFQLRKAFDGAGLQNGAMPAYPVNVAIERLVLKPATPLIPQMSVFRVRMEIARPDAEILMRGQFQSYLSGPTFMVIGGGVVAPIALPAKDWEYVALAKMFPAVAIVITTTTQGLQQGKTLDQIKVYPQDIEAGNIISPDLFLKNSPFGITQISGSVIDSVIRASRAGPQAEKDHTAIQRMKSPAVGSGMDCVRMAEIAEWAAGARDRGTGRDEVLATAVTDHPAPPSERVRLFAGRVFEAPVPAHLAAAEAYSACLGNRADLGEPSLSRERVDFIAVCAQKVASGGAVLCGYAEIASRTKPPRPIEPIPSELEVQETSGQLERALVVVRSSSSEQLGVVAPGGEFAITLMSNLTVGQEVSLSPRGSLTEWLPSRVVGVDAGTRIAVIAPLPPNLQPTAVVDPSSLAQWQPLIALKWASKQIAARLVALVEPEELVAHGAGASACWPTFAEMVADGREPEIAGPVFDLRGHLVAFGSIYYSVTGRILPLYANFGYPANTVVLIAERLRRYGYWRHGRIGIVVQEVTPEIAFASEMSEATGAFVAGVERDGPADKAGLRPSDVILAMNGQRLASSCELTGRILTSSPGDVVSLTVQRRNGPVLTIDIRTAENLRPPDH
jgi:S1-C subfamily serine protease